MKMIEIDSYRYFDPVFEGIRVILNQMGEAYTPEYISGISGSAFKIAGGCPSRPTCVCDFWPADFFKYMGYEVSEYACADADGNDVSEKMIRAVKTQIDGGKAALVWHAFRDEEWDVVCGYDEDSKEFIGKGNYHSDYARQPWDRAMTSNVHAFGAVIPSGKISNFSAREAEIDSLKRAAAHGRKVTETHEFFQYEGIQSYKKWAAIFAAPGADRGVADSYCYDAYSSVRCAAVLYLRGLAEKYGGAAGAHLEGAAASFEIETGALKRARPYISWDSPWGVDETRSKLLAPLLADAAAAYEKGIESIEKALLHLK